VSNNQLIASVKQKHLINMNWKKSVSVSFAAYLPVHVTTELETSGGSISLSSLDGTHSFRTSGGSISVDNVNGKMKGRGSGGSISYYAFLERYRSCYKRWQHPCKRLHGRYQAENIRRLFGNWMVLTGRSRLKTSGGSINADEYKG